MAANTANGLESGARDSSFPAASDEELLSAITGGATWALEMLYQRYHKGLYSLIYKMVSDHPTVEDLLQETFLSVWRRACTYSAQAGAVRSWLFTISRNHTIDYVRKMRQRSTPKELPLWEIEFDERFADSDAAEEASLHEQQGQVRKALGHLPEKRRIVLELSYFQGWTHTEIAERCNMPLGSVKSSMRLGLLQLKRELEEDTAFTFS
jgi:RNA polymerase sigma factor (sigma-70 family)